MGSSPDQSGLAPLVVFLDENHCRNPHLRDALTEQDVPFVLHLDLFAPGTADLVWLPHVGRNSWSLLTTDKNIRSHPLERESVRDHGVRMFYFSTNQVSGFEMGQALRRAIPKMRSIVATTPPPFTVAINRKGEVAPPRLL